VIQCRYNLTKSLKRADADGTTSRISVTVDLKRRSPTVSEKRGVVDFTSAGKFTELLARVGTDALLINTDDMEYGGKLEELREAATAVRSIPMLSIPPACIRKDLIIHPIQVALKIAQRCTHCSVLTRMAIFVAAADRSGATARRLGRAAYCSRGWSGP
jgi:indole-3-glycerol phosphate synthase